VSVRWLDSYEELVQQCTNGKIEKKEIVYRFGIVFRYSCADKIRSFPSKLHLAIGR